MALPPDTLGMKRAISRRDFLNGVALTVGATLAVPGDAWSEVLRWPAPDSTYYPPARGGLRGSHDGSWEVAHALRDGQHWPHARSDSAEYDLVVVGAGISGLAAAYFYRRYAGPKSRILILDNHDDFGGHAKRNEFRAEGRLLLGYGGTQSIADPGLYSPEARRLLGELGIETQKFEKYYDRQFFSSRDMHRAVFFDREAFGADCLVNRVAEPSWPEFLARTPLAQQAQKDLARLYTEKID